MAGRHLAGGPAVSVMRAGHSECACAHCLTFRAAHRPTSMRHTHAHPPSQPPRHAASPEEPLTWMGLQAARPPGCRCWWGRPPAVPKGLVSCGPAARCQLQSPHAARGPWAARCGRLARWVARLWRLQVGGERAQGGWCYWQAPHKHQRSSRNSISMPRPTGCRAAPRQPRTREGQRGGRHGRLRSAAGGGCCGRAREWHRRHRHFMGCRQVRRREGLVLRAGVSRSAAGVTGGTYGRERRRRCSRASRAPLGLPSGPPARTSSSSSGTRLLGCS